MQYTNDYNIPLICLPWLLSDTYDYIPEEKSISATTLLKPIRQTILSQRVLTQSADVSDLIASRLGTSIHDSIERSWVEDPYNSLRTLRLLGYPEDVLDRVIINPKPQQIGNRNIPLYIEQRSQKKLIGWNISGKFDYIFDGMLGDIKTTSTYNYTSDNRTEDYKKQLSIYWWLNPDKITSAEAEITMFFTDWQKHKIKQDPSYPKSRIASKRITLTPPDITEKWLIERIRLLERELQKDEPIECTEEELWFPKPVYAYYGNPLKLDRATKLFDSIHDAEAYRAEKGKGIVIPKPREPKRCNYCPAFDICSQRKRLFND